ncbi:enamine deaminase RidA (YjgF/YER057c/UK114 family) [Rhizobium sp. BK512]|uniref:RidA family protein n=1 Tax=Rhizobium sp. BK512 TaxID=2587010 RepID=UPI000DDD02D1|nr:RidA family protein [Rhizobium sp. BK512]MBB3562096.1 enamine deaminase RidA (YjgF/YER057c/UK114 family) [Rhizobium sp. BK512]
MELVKHSPSAGIYAATSDYIHAMEVRNPTRFLFVSGTMGLDAEGAPGKDLSVQLDLIWSNLRAILTDAGMGVSNIVRLTSYLGDAGHAEANQNARLAALGDHIVPTTAIVVQTLQKDWLVEIEIIAAA